MARIDAAATSDALSTRQRRRVRMNTLAVIPYLMIVLLLAVWESVAHSSLVTPFMLPSIEAVAARIGVDITSGDVFVNLTSTLYRTVVGFGISAVAGVTLGVLMV